MKGRPGIIRRGLWLPAELYLQPDRFRWEIDSLAGEGRELSFRRAIRVARANPEARSALADLGTRIAVAMVWPALICGALAMAGVPVGWPRFAVGIAVAVIVGVVVAGNFGVASGVAFWAATGVAFGVSYGVGSSLVFGAASGMAFGVVFAPRAFEVVVLVASGVAYGVILGLPSGVGLGVASGLAMPRLLLAPVDLVVARVLRGRLSAGMASGRVWHFHPARWDPVGRFPLPGLAQILAELQLADPAAGVAAVRVVTANPTRRPALARATVIVADRLTGRVSSVAALASLSTDLQEAVDEALLPPGERDEVRVLAEASEEVAAARASDSVANRVTRLRAAAKALAVRNPGSEVIARHRGRLASLLAEALTDAERAQREQEPVPAVYVIDGLPLGLNRATLFKGRTRVFARIEELLGSERRATVILHGPRRHGKTSILIQLPARLGPSVIPVFVDLQSGLGSAETATTFLSGLADEVTAQASAHRNLTDLPELPPGEPYPAFDDWLGRLGRAIGDRHLLLCLDEFEKLQEQIEAGRLDTRILDLLRNIAQHHPKVTVALTGVVDLTELPPAWASKLVNAVSIEVGPLDEPDARELIVEPVLNYPPVYAEEAVDSILRATACQPYLVQMLCSVLVASLNERHWQPGDPQVTAADVAAAMDGAATKAGNYFLDVWRSQVPEDTRSLVRDLAQKSELALDAETADRLRESILALERRRIVRRVERGLALEAPLLGEYIRRYQSVSVGPGVAGGVDGGDLADGAGLGAHHE